MIILRDGKFRRVVNRRGNDIDYFAGKGYGNPATFQEDPKPRICWITTWQEWCRRKDVKEVLCG